MFSTKSKASQCKPFLVCSLASEDLILESDSLTRKLKPSATLKLTDTASGYWLPECLTGAFPQLPSTEILQHSTGDLGVDQWVVGGFPCQDLSTAGKRVGLDGERSGL